MGLDQYFYKSHPHLSDDEKSELDEPEIAYFRKCNFLNAYIEKHALDGQEVPNCSYVPVPRAVLESLCADITTVLREPEKGPELLPTQSGFFFGNTDYDEMYLSNLRSTRSTIAQMLDGNSDDTFDYYIWW